MYAHRLRETHKTLKQVFWEEVEDDEVNDALANLWADLQDALGLPYVRPFHSKIDFDTSLLNEKSWFYF